MRGQTTQGDISAFAGALAVAFTAAAVDLVPVIRRSPWSWESTAEIVAGLAAVVVPIVLLGLAAWYLLARPAGRLAGLAPRPLLVALLLFGLTAFALLSSQQFLSGKLLRAENRLPVFFTVAGAAFVAWCVYQLLRLWPRQDRARFVVGRLSRAVPAIALTIVFLEWARARADLGLFVAIALLAAVATAATVVVLRVAPRVIDGALAVLLLATAAWGLVTAASHTEFVSTDDVRRASSTHDVKQVILITIDTLRADALSLHNPGIATSPRIDQLADDAVVFERAYSASSWTKPSIAALMTGLPTYAHGVWEFETLADEFPTLAESFRDAGYATAAIVENPVLHPAGNYFQGFEEYAFYPRFPPSGDALGRRVLRRLFPARYRAGGTPDVTASAAAWIEGHRDEDFFLWVHYLDPHVPYIPPRRLLGDAEPAPSIGYDFADHQQVRGGRKLSQAERDWVRKLYLAEVRYVDENVGMLLDALEDLGIYDDSVVVLTSDHGEEFWEHGRYEHGHSLYEELIRVPLILKLPGSSEQERVAGAVANLQVMSTLLEICGLPQPDRCYAAPSLSPWWTGAADEGAARTAAQTTILSAGTVTFDDKEAVLFDSLKFIRTEPTVNEELYDLAADPDEQHSLAEPSPDTATRGRQLLDDLRQHFEQIRSCYVRDAAELQEMTPELEERLRSLGYIQ